jgi:hypothetical protein
MVFSVVSRCSFLCDAGVGGSPRKQFDIRTIQRPESLNPDSIRPTSRRHPIHLSLRLSLAGPTSGVADPGEHME